MQNNINTATKPPKPDFKLTELGWIPKDWELKKLANVSLIDNHKVNFNKFIDEQILYVSISDVFEKKVYPSKIDFNTAPSRARKIAKKGDVLLTTVRPNLKNFSKILNYDFLVVSTGFCVLTKKQDSIDFIYHVIFSQHFDRQFYKLLVGSSYPALNASDVKKLRVPLPPLPEQKAIADCLSTWDQAIEKQQELIHAKQQQHKGLRQILLTGKKRLTNPETGKAFDGEWVEKRLGEISERINRKNNGQSDNVVTISAQRGFIRQEDFFNKRVASKTLNNYTLVCKGEFCYNKSYSNGYPMGAFKRLDDYDDAVVTTLYICFSVKETVNSDFLNSYFQAGYMNRNLSRVAQEGGRAHGLLNIGINDFFNLKLSIPHLKEQTAIAEVLETSSKEIEILQKQLHQLQLQKKGLMQVLLSGEKRLVG